MVPDCQRSDLNLEANEDYLNMLAMDGDFEEAEQFLFDTVQENVFSNLDEPPDK